MPSQIPQDQYVTVGTINTRFWALGDEGPPVVLIHGIGASIESWALNIRPLAQTHRTYALDLVGSGRSDKPSATYTLSYLAEFVADFMQTKGIERASVVGHSLGGGVALKLAIEHPERIEKLVLLGSAGLGREGHVFFRLSSLPIVGELLTRPSRKGTAQFLEECFHDPAMVTEKLIELNYELSSLPGAQEAYLSALRAIATPFGARKEVIESIVDNLDQITAPTLIVWGAQDQILPVAHAHVAEKKMTDAELHILEDCGHMPQMEKAAAFNPLVSKFLSS